MALLKISLVLASVFITLATAALLNYAAKTPWSGITAPVFLICLVILINLVKLKTWGFLYQRFQLCETYPLVSLFFPLLYLLAIINGETQPEMQKTVGATAITFGVFLLSRENRAS